MDPVLVGAHLTIDLGALQDNYRLLAQKAAPAICAASVKANAYGLGIEKVGPALADAGCQHFFVALPTEGIDLRKLLPDAKIYVLGGLLKEAEKYYLEHNLIPVLNHLQEIEMWADYANEVGPLSAVLHVDTGITRLGLLENEIRSLAATPSLLDSLKIEYVMSHLACADDRTHPLNQQQLEKLHYFKGLLPEKLQETPISFANSAGIFLSKDYHFDMVRPGIALFGGNPMSAEDNPMKEVVHLQGKILQVQDVDSEIHVGYGATYRTQEVSRIATVSVGYADGYFRSLGNRAECAIKQNKVPVIGRVSMDIITIDVSTVAKEDCQPGDFVDLIGNGVTLDEVAAHAETIPYEILTSLGNRYYREYLEPVA
ncbi:MAG: alanine racemase [Proteobacteria bacterium]|nr:alanine racemase [Pseudomonadota bacterium]